METWAQTLLAVVCSVIASSGFWAFWQKRMEHKDVKIKMLCGLAHDRIIDLGLCYIERGWISEPEYQNLKQYLCAPYQALGGNGTVGRIMAEVDSLPIRHTANIPPVCRRALEWLQVKDDKYFFEKTAPTSQE